MNYLSDKIYLINGEHLGSFIITNEALLFSSKPFFDMNEFNEAWAKRFSLTSKKEVAFVNIQSVTREIPGKTTYIFYKGSLNVTHKLAFSFDNPVDFNEFAEFLEKELFFRRTEQQLSRTKAIIPQLVCFIGVTLAFIAGTGKNLQ